MRHPEDASFRPCRKTWRLFHWISARCRNPPTRLADGLGRESVPIAGAICAPVVDGHQLDWVPRSTVGLTKDSAAHGIYFTSSGEFSKWGTLPNVPCGEARQRQDHGSVAADARFAAWRVGKRAPRKISSSAPPLLVELTRSRIREALFSSGNLNDGHCPQRRNPA